MRKRESELQINCVKWFRYAYPQYKLLLFAIPNGGFRNLYTAIRLKREGVVSGVPDLFLSIARNGWNGFYIEMKTEKTKLSDNQERFIESVSKHNYKIEVIRSFDQFQREVTYYLNSNQ